MIHIRIDNQLLNSKREFACGLGPDLPEGHVYFFAAESAHRGADFPGCNAHVRQFGTPISRLSGRPGQSGFEQFSEIAATWGYE